MSRNRDEINKQLQQIFRDIFEDDGIEIFDEMTANDIGEWDSLMHVILVVAIEKEFGLTLNAAEVGNLENVGKMLDILETRATK